MTSNEERKTLENRITNRLSVVGTLDNAYVIQDDTTGRIITLPYGTLALATQAAIDLLPAGLVILKDNDCPAGIVHKSGVSVMAINNGIVTFTGRYAHAGQPGIVTDQPVMRFIPTEEWGKPILEWRDLNGNRLAWIVGHWKQDAATEHKHLSIETSKADGSLTTRFDVSYGVNQAKIRFTESDAEFGSKVDFLAALTAKYVSTATTPYTLGGTDFFLAVDASGGAKVVNLPTANGLNGRIYIIKKTDNSANTVTVTPNGAETIEGLANFVLDAQYETLALIARGASGWYIFAKIA